MITLGIIGIVAALTIPSLMQSYRKHFVETRLSKFYTTVNQAVKLSEIENGDKKTWETDFGGWHKDKDGNIDTTIPPKAMYWYNKYLNKYLKTIKVEYDRNDPEGKAAAYLPDGSLVLISSSSILFYPNAKDYELTDNGEKGYIRDKKLCGIKYFTFNFAPSGIIKPLYNKGVEPYINKEWDGTREMLLNNPKVGCNENAANERAYCTALIQMDGWKIPDDYPFKF